VKHLSSNKSQHKNTVRSLDRALKILNKLSEEDSLGVTELSEKVGLNKSTTYRLLNTLAANNYVEQDQSTSRYRLGLRLFQLGNIVASRIQLRSEAQPFLKQLSKAYGCAAHLVILLGNEAFYLEKVENPDALVTYSQIGKKLPLHATAAGKILLAYMPEKKQESLLAGQLASYTKNTIADVEVLRVCLSRIKENGYAFDNEELEEGLRCVAAPIRDFNGQVSAAVSISALAVKLKWEENPELIEDVKNTARMISERMGYLG
jgi:IclR family KDG regulon transcriptional repressor